MTRETAIALLNNLRAFAEDDDEPAIDMAIEALSTEPKTKCIAQIRIDQGDMANLVNKIVDKMSEPKTGHWISDNLVGWKCSECGRHIVLNIEVGNYCPNCGARMNGDIK